MFNLKGTFLVWFSQGCREFPLFPYFFVLTVTDYWTKMHRLLFLFHLFLLKFCLRSGSQNLLRLLLCSCKGLFLHRYICLIFFFFFWTSLLEMLESLGKTCTTVPYLSCILVSVSLAVDLIYISNTATLPWQLEV